MEIIVFEMSIIKLTSLGWVYVILSQTRLDLVKPDTKVHITGRISL